MNFLLAVFLLISGNALAQEFSASRDSSGALAIEGAVKQGSKIADVLEKKIDEISNCGASPDYNLYDGTGCIEPEVDPVADAHAKAVMPNCPNSNETAYWDGSDWVCRPLSGVVVDCLVTRTVPGGCVAFSSVAVSDTASETGYCSLGGNKGCYSTVTCNMGVQTFTSEQCYNSEWVTGPWQIPCYDDDPSPLSEDWKWNRSVTCPTAGDCDNSVKPATVGACGVVAAHGKCGSSINACSSGTFSDVSDSSTTAYWDCNGVNGGNDITCSQPLPPPANCFDSVAGAGCSAFQSVNHGDTDSWSCDAGYTGSCGAECNNGSFINTTNTCASVPDCASTVINEWSTPSGSNGLQATCVFMLPDGMNGDTQTFAHNSGSCQETIPMLKLLMSSPTCSGSYTCVGNNWVKSSFSGSCSATPVNGQCSTTPNNCVKGTVANYVNGPSAHTWDCLGSSGGSNDSCYVSKTAGCAATTINKSRTTANGKQFCGFSLPAGVNGDSTTSSNSTGLCDWTNAGDANCSGTFTCDGTTWKSSTWSATCILNPVSGVCGSSVDSCDFGNFVDESDNASNYKWRCEGVDGGADSSCTMPKSGGTWSAPSLSGAAPHVFCGPLPAPAGSAPKSGSCSSIGDVWNYSQMMPMSDPNYATFQAQCNIITTDFPYYTYQQTCQ